MSYPVSETTAVQKSMFISLMQVASVARGATVLVTLLSYKWSCFFCNRLIGAKYFYF